VIRVAHVNQDAGIRPEAAKGAWVHVDRLRAALAAIGADVIAIDEPDGQRARALLADACVHAPLDLIYERYSLGAYTASQYAHERGIPHVLEVNAPLQDEAARHRPAELARLNQEHEGTLFSNAAQVFVVSPALRPYARARGTPDDRIQVTPNGVDSERFMPRGVHDTLRSSIVPANHFVLGFHGRLRPWHHFDALVTVAADLIAAGRPLFVLTVGRGEFQRELKGRLPADSYHCIDWVPHAQVGRYVACFDALPLAYAEEAESYFSPLKLFEAMAAGVVPVVPRLGELPSYVEDLAAGLVYTAGDSDDLRAALLRLIDDEQLRTRLAKSAIRVARGHSWTQIAETVIRSVVAVS
jgi:glycosyltransferase involved in cell wall biosynthesis